MSGNPLIKKFEKQLQIAINSYLRDKGHLTNGHGHQFYTCMNTASNICVSARGEYQKNILLTYLGCPTNTQPCISGYVDLRLKKQGEETFKKERFFFHICTNNYRVIENVEEIALADVDFFIKQGERYF